MLLSRCQNPIIIDVSHEVISTVIYVLPEVMKLCKAHCLQGRTRSKAGQVQGIASMFQCVTITIPGSEEDADNVSFENINAMGWYR